MIFIFIFIVFFIETDLRCRVNFSQLTDKGIFDFVTGFGIVIVLVFILLGVCILFSFLCISLGVPTINSRFLNLQNSIKGSVRYLDYSDAVLSNVHWYQQRILIKVDSVISDHIMVIDNLSLVINSFQLEKRYIAALKSTFQVHLIRHIIVDLLNQGQWLINIDGSWLSRVHDDCCVSLLEVSFVGYINVHLVHSDLCFILRVVEQHVLLVSLQDGQLFLVDHEHQLGRVKELWTDKYVSYGDVLSQILVENHHKWNCCRIFLVFRACEWYRVVTVAESTFLVAVEILRGGNVYFLDVLEHFFEDVKVVECYAGLGGYC